MSGFPRFGLERRSSRTNRLNSSDTSSEHGLARCAIDQGHALISGFTDIVIMHRDAAYQQAPREITSRHGPFVVQVEPVCEDCAQTNYSRTPEAGAWCVGMCHGGSPFHVSAIVTAGCAQFRHNRGLMPDLRRVRALNLECPQMCLEWSASAAGWQRCVFWMTSDIRIS